MERRPFSEVLANAKIDLSREYERLYFIFNIEDNDSNSWRDICERFFLQLPFRGTYLSLSEFDECNGFVFELPASDFDINYLINYCEYIYNLIVNINQMRIFSNSRFPDPIEHILGLIEKIGYMIITKNGFSLFVPKSQPAIRVSEMLPSDISYKVIEYNHHSMKGDLERKQATLKLLADQLEARKDELNSINSSLKSDLFFLFNNINIRHNNVDPKSNSYKKAVADMPDDELEEWYDRTYDMCLYAFMTLEQADNKEKIKALKEKIENSKK